MGAKVLRTILNNTPAFVTDINQFFEAFVGNFAPRNSSGVPSNNTESIGEENFRFKDLFSHKINITSPTAIDFEIEAKNDFVKLSTTNFDEVFRMTKFSTLLHKRYTKDEGDELTVQEYPNYIQELITLSPLATKDYTVTLKGGCLFVNSGFDILVNGKVISRFGGAPYFDAGTYTVTARNASPSSSLTYYVQIFEVV